ncbi:hypothetical protein Tco_1081564 [Tanacetum coccineum]|uniref:Uncharacterized protein n=1 Tax=Tanacetum coccineum TaxID=301880 RepID=A0ABQ5HYU2_9ASTR
MPNILPIHPTLQMDFDFIPSPNDLGSDLDVSSPFGDRNKIYDLDICIKVESTRFLATLSPVIDTLLPFSSENEDKVFNHGVLASKDKSPPSSSHRGLKASKLFHQKSLMLIHGDNTPNLDFEASRARGFVLRLPELQILSFIMGIRYPNLIDNRLSLSILNKRLRIYIETLLKTLRTMDLRFDKDYKDKKKQKRSKTDKERKRQEKE